VESVDDGTRSVWVTPFDDPPGGWKLPYPEPVQATEPSDLPGLSPAGGGYLRRFDPVGTPCFYWGRLDHEWDLSCQAFGFRLVPGICDAPGDLSLDGRNWTRPKDYVQFHEVVRAIVRHLVERYGDVTTTWTWSILNEPDLSFLFWRTGDWVDLQRFYDYASDAVLRTFEDCGYDSSKIHIGGLELAGVSGLDLRIDAFLSHCSPRPASGPDILAGNAAFGDPRLDGKRSARVERLCSAHQGRGAPLDFVSVHTYNGAEMAAAKLVHAKERALAIDPESFRDLSIHNFESVPTWVEIPDPGAAEAYLDNGYFASWIADVVRRRLQQAAGDSRFAFGESLLTVWGWTNKGFESRNDVVREIRVADRSGQGERSILVPMQAFHTVNLLSDMGDSFHVLPVTEVSGHVVSGFASTPGDGGEIRVLLYVHDTADTQSRSEDLLRVDLRIPAGEAGRHRVTRYAMDRRHNSHHDLALRFGERSGRDPSAAFDEDELEGLEERTALRGETTDAIPEADGPGAGLVLSLTVRLPVNGVCCLHIRPVRQ